MNRYTCALLQKEWIKLKYVLWIIPVFLVYAAADSYFILTAIERNHDLFGLWSVLITKEPPFTDSFKYIVFCGFIIGFCQARPETHGRHLRLLFHMPLLPERIVGTMLLLGLAIMTLINLFSVLAIIMVMKVYSFPSDIIVPVLYSFAPMALLSFISYLSIFAILGCKKPGLQALIILSCSIMYLVLWGVGGYSTWKESIAQYAFLNIGLLFVCIFSYMQSIDEPHKNTLFSCSRAITFVFFAIILCIMVPKQFWRIYIPSLTTQRLYYSPTHDQFVKMQVFPVKKHTHEHGGSKYSLEDGTELNSKELALALPTFYADNLLKWNMFPKEIDGKKLTLQQIKYDWHYYNLSPRDIHGPRFMLEMLIETNPVGAKFENATDFFRIRHDKTGIEFIDPIDGNVIKEKSDMFTKALADNGFEFPVANFGGNPNIKKDHDMGYVFVDSKGAVVTLQMYDGKPLVKKVQGQITGTVRALDIEENKKKEFFGYIATDDGVFALGYKPLALTKLPLEKYNPKTTQFYMWSDSVSKYIVQNDNDKRNEGFFGQAFTVDFAPERTYTLPAVQQDIDAMDSFTNIASALFPLRILQYSSSSKYQAFDVTWTQKPYVTLVANLLSMMLLFLYLRHYKKPYQSFDFVLVGIFGPIGLLVVFLATFSTKKCKSPF